MKITGYTKDGTVEVEVHTPKDELKVDLSNAVSLQQEIDAIKKYLGVL